MSLLLTSQDSATIPLEYPAPTSQGWEAFLANLTEFNVKLFLVLIICVWIFHLIIENGGQK